MRLGTSSITSTSLAVPPTQNTAPVLEFNCLYTHDIKRKSKRWQDGFLRFHTFNKRVMVYDESRNFIGDAHWTDTESLQEGDEVKLDKNGVLVQVADKIGQTETDLTDLRKSKNKPTGNPASSSPLRLSSAISIVNLTNHERQPLQAKHRSLNALLGSGRKPIGKAVLPNKSPYEIRKELAYEEGVGDWAQQRSAKRRRISDTEHVSPIADASRAFPTARPPAIRTSTIPTKSCRHTGAKTPAKSPGAKETPVRTKHKPQPIEIDLCSDDEHSGIFSSMLAEPMLQSSKQPPRPPKVAVSVQKPISTETTGKRLSIARTTSKRNTLACHTMVDNDMDTRVQQAQKDRVEARLARLRERKMLNASATVSDTRITRQKTNHSARQQKSPMRPPELSLEAVQPAVIDIPSSQPPNDVPILEEAPDTAQDDKSYLMDIDTDADIVNNRIVPEARLELAQDDLAAFDDSPSPEFQDESAETYAHDETAEVVMTGDATPSQDMQPENRVLEEKGQASAPGTLVVPLEVAELLEIPQHDGVVVPEDTKHPGADGPKMAVQPLADISVKLGDVTDAQPPPASRRKRVTRTGVRKSASCCFKPPTPAARNITPTTSTRGDALDSKPSTNISSTRTAGAWSREAFDLFTWRPPDWDDDSWTLKA